MKGFREFLQKSERESCQQQKEESRSTVGGGGGKKKKRYYEIPDDLKGSSSCTREDSIVSSGRSYGGQGLEKKVPLVSNDYQDQGT